MDAKRIKSGLNTKVIGKEVYAFDDVDSTNTVALNMAEEGIPEGAVIVAESQNKGRGRFDRVWFSPVGVNLYLSVILRPSLPLKGIPVITLMAGVAAVDAIQRSTGVKNTLKWPNDIVIDDKKTGGILTEAKGQGGNISYLVVGVGINVNMDEATLPKELFGKTTSIKTKIGRETDRIALLQGFLKELDAWYERFIKEGPSPVVEAWKGRTNMLGRKIVVNEGNRTIEGIAEDLNRDGALLLRPEMGPLEVIVAGEVVSVCSLRLT